MPSLSGLEPGQSLVVGVSGGPDSLALLHCLHALHYPLLVASFNHRLRPDAAADVDFVGQFAAALGLPFVSGSADVAAHAAAEGLSIEEAARELRYRFLFSEARKAGAQAVAVGHTANDQAETVLMHFLRGAGLAGLKGMPARIILPAFDPHIPLTRPILNWSRADTEAYCRKYQLTPRIDASNADVAYFRNRLRHELLPALEQYNPQISQSLAKTALALQGDYELINEIVATAWLQAVSATGQDYVAFKQLQLHGLSPALRRNLFRKAAFMLKPGLRDVDFEALERAASLKPVDLAGGLRTLLEGETIYLTTNPASLPSLDWPQIDQQRSLGNGLISLADGWSLRVEENSADVYAQARNNSDPFTVWLDAELVEDNLLVRSFQSGDRFEPLGMPRQTIKLAELFINLKVPKRVRAHWPLVCVGAEIAWVTGLRLSDRFKVTDKTTRALKIEVIKPEGQV